MGKSHGSRTGTAFLFATTAVIFSLTSLAYAQSNTPLPELLTTPPAQIPNAQDYPATPSYPTSDSVFLVEPSSSYSAILDPIVADESGLIITTEDQPEDADEY